jgi:ferrous iron transport protein A
MQNIAPSSLPLAILKTGEHAYFESISSEKAVASRLTSLGFTPGVEIEMTQNFGRGPLLVTLRGARVALGREEARQITVQKEGL